MSPVSLPHSSHHSSCSTSHGEESTPGPLPDSPALGFACSGLAGLLLIPLNRAVLGLVFGSLFSVELVQAEMQRVTAQGHRL